MAQEKKAVFAQCVELGEATVLADLERGGGVFLGPDAALAWEWVYQQRLNRERATEKAMRDTARLTMWIALATGLVAAFTAGLVIVEIVGRH